MGPLEEMLAAQALLIKDVQPAVRFCTNKAGAYTRPLFQLSVSTFCETRWLVSLCQ